MFGKEKVKQQYTIVVKNVGGDLLRTFEEDQFEEVIKYIENGPHGVNNYRIQLVKKGPVVK